MAYMTRGKGISRNHMHLNETMKNLVTYTADLHGNEQQYRKLVNFAISNSAQSVIIGGDIAPGSASIEHLIWEQRSFLSQPLLRLLSPLKEELPNCQIHLIMGNDDCACNLDVLEKNGLPFHVIHGRRLKLTEDFEIVGYPYVPITPFMLKDWEKYDLSQVPRNLREDYRRRKILNYKLFGFKTEGTRWKGFRFTSEMEKEDSIQKDLEKSVFTKKPGETVYVIHTPPNNTHLDQRYDGYHVGSMALRLFIERHQPYLTMHGHVHETVERSGEYKQEIGKTLCLTAGNSDLSHGLAVLLFDLYNPRNVTRELI
jgi:Icc-related predicted phosphoesterase